MFVGPLPAATVWQPRGAEADALQSSEVWPPWMKTEQAPATKEAVRHRDPDAGHRRLAGGHDVWRLGRADLH